MKYILSSLFLFAALFLFADAEIQVTYSGFNTEQQAAFEYAASLWEPVLNSSVPIKINARFLPVPGFLHVVIPNLIHAFPGGPTNNLWHANALANAMTGNELNPGEADMDIIINASNPWYYGLSGNCPTNSYDFVTEMMKGISYGLGYMSSFYIQQGMGTYGLLDPSVLGLTTTFPWEPMQGYPTLYDTHVINTQGQFLTEIFTGPSTALAAQLTGGNLRYWGTYGMEYTGGEQPVLYASTYNLARTARLDGTTYESTENGPGVPTGAFGAALHFPSPIVLGILQDQGWSLNLDSLTPAPINLSAVVEPGGSGDVNVFWDSPPTPYDIHMYYTYRNGELVATGTATGIMELGLPAGTHYYTVVAQYSLGLSNESEAVEVIIPTSNNDEVIPSLPGLSIKVSPNPFTDSCQIGIRVKTTSLVEVELYDIKGRLIDRMHTGVVDSGSSSLNWDGKTSTGQRLPTGVYFVKMTAGNFISTQKLILVK